MCIVAKVVDVRAVVDVATVIAAGGVALTVRGVVAAVVESIGTPFGAAGATGAGTTAVLIGVYAGRHGRDICPQDLSARAPGEADQGVVVAIVEMRAALEGVGEGERTAVAAETVGV